MNTPKTITKTTNNNKKHGWTAETFVQIVDSCTYTDPTPKVGKLVSYYERLARLDNSVSEGMRAYSIRDPMMKPNATMAKKTFSTPQEAREAYLARKAKGSTHQTTSYVHSNRRRSQLSQHLH